MQVSLRDFVDSTHQRRHAHGRPFFCRKMQRPLKGRGHEVPQALLDIRSFPEKPLGVLHPLEIGDDHSTRIRQNIGYHENVLVLDDLISFQGRGAVGSFR